MNRESTVSEPDVDITSHFSFVVQRVRRFYKLFFFLGVVFGLLTIIYAHLATPVYSAVAALMPPKGGLIDISGDTMSGGLASLSRKFGLGGGGGDDDVFEEYTRILQSYRLAGVLAQQPSFLKLAFPDEYDPQTKHLRAPAGAMTEIKNGVKSFLGLRLTRASDQDRIYKFLDDNLSVSTPSDPNSDISEVTFRFDDLAASQEILEHVLAEADSLMRADKRHDIAARIDYLQAQLSKTGLEEQRSAIISILTKQQYTMMVLSADHRYASYVVEPPHTPAKPMWPTGGSLVALALFLAFVTGGAAIVFLPADGRLLRIFANDVRTLSVLRTMVGRPRSWGSAQDALRENR